jgi:hypothetical protein
VVKCVEKRRQTGLWPAMQQQRHSGPSSLSGLDLRIIDPDTLASFRAIVVAWQ